MSSQIPPQGRTHCPKQWDTLRSQLQKCSQEHILPGAAHSQWVMTGGRMSAHLGQLWWAIYAPKVLVELARASWAHYSLNLPFALSCSSPSQGYWLFRNFPFLSLPWLPLPQVKLPSTWQHFLPWQKLPADHLICFFFFLGRRLDYSASLPFSRVWPVTEG